MKKYAVIFFLLTLSGCEIFLPPSLGSPSVVEVVPAGGTQNVSPGAAVKVELDLPNGGLSLTSATPNSVTLTDTATGQVVDTTIRIDNNSESLTLTPTNDLGFATEYRFDLTNAVEDETGQALEAYSSTFTTLPDGVPAVLRSRPADGDNAVSIYDTSAINNDINAIGGGVDPASLGSASVYLTNRVTGERIGGTASTSGGGDTITFALDGQLTEGTEYQFDVTSGVQAVDGTPFIPYTSTFTTSGSGSENPTQPTPNVELAFQQTSNEVRHSSLAVGPDGNLYASTIDGRILRYPIAEDGSLGAPETLTTLTDPDGSPRLIIGFTFDPTATADNLIAWVSSTSFTGFIDGGSLQNNNETFKWAGKITRLGGINLTTQQDVVVGLPRSSKDHVTNSIAFNPAEPGVLYFIQGSNTAMGAPDSAWRFQEERVLTGAVLRLDYAAVGAETLNVQTEEGGTYDPFASGAPLTVYASGTRNAYDLVWHSNGNLYVPGNGSAAGGNMPRYAPIPGTCENRTDGGYSGTMLTDTSALPNYVSTGTIPDGATVPVDGWRINQTMNDYLFRIEQGGYYGTPNPKRCEWILFGGGVGTGSKDDIIDGFPSSVTPDPNYRGYAHNFGQNISPNGVIEYQGTAFSQYNGMLLVVRYATGDNIVALTLDGSGNVTGEEQPVVGNNSFADPIDLTEDPRTGFLYVSSYDQTDENPKPTGITLVRPQ